jgi:glycosyltransferase involved in cell wall biosynthesis
MKVLWFSLSPGLGEAVLSDKYEGIGWVKSLEKNIQSRVELSVAFQFDKLAAPFKLGPTMYYPINRYRYGNLTKIKKRLFNSIGTEYDNTLFLKVVEQVKPDLIHIHGTEAAYGLVQKYTDIPTVISIQGTITVYRYKFFSKVTWVDVLKYSSFKNLVFARTFIHVYQRFSKIAAREREIYAYGKYFIGRTAWDRRVTKVLAPAAKYYHNDEILRSAFYHNEWVYKPSPKLQLLTTIWGNVYKGLETLLDCARLLDELGINYEWTVAGIRADEEVVKICAKGKKSTISKNVTFLGVINEAALIDQQLHTHLFIATSHIENSPNSLCEALILGVPCIATNAGGTASLMNDNKEGILIQDGDPYAMAGAILELKENYAAAIRFGANARKRALVRHDQAKITDDLIAIYCDILQNGSGDGTAPVDIAKMTNDVIAAED